KHCRGKVKVHMPRYFKTTVPFSPTTVDQEASGYIWGDESAICPVCLLDDLKRFSRIVIKEDTWNGDDIFSPRGGIRIMVSERFKTKCEEHAIRGVIYSRADKYGHELCPSERADWDIRLFDETLAILRSENTGRRLDDLIQAMIDLREQVAATPKLEWI